MISQSLDLLMTASRQSQSSQTLAAEIGIELQLTKSQLVCFHPNGLTAAQTSTLEGLNVPVHTESASFLGCSLASNRNTQAEHVRQMINGLTDKIDVCAKDYT